MVYVASPYSHPKASVREKRAQMAARVCGDLIQQGLFVFCPIVQYHPIAKICSLPTHWKYWDVHCRLFMKMATSMIVLKAPGWEESEGLQEEIKIAEEMNIPITYMEQGRAR